MTTTLNMTASSLTRALTQLTASPSFDAALHNAAVRAADRVEPTLSASGSLVSPMVVSGPESPELRLADTDRELVREILA